jgi:hypothetical protein
MLERLRLFRNKNKTAGDKINSESNVIEASSDKQKEQSAEDIVSTNEPIEDQGLQK